MNWDIVETSKLTQEMLDGLIDNMLAAVIVPHFASAEECAAVVKALIPHNSKSYTQLPEDWISKVGVGQSEYFSHPEGKTDYFRQAAEAEYLRKEIMLDTGDFLDKMIKSFQVAWPSNVDVLANAETGERYYAGVFRFINTVGIHSDWVPRDAPDWDNAQVSAQIAINLYLQSAEKGGELVIYNKLWQPADEHWKKPTEVGYYTDVVESSRSVCIAPQVGSLILFNCRNFHEVKAIEGNTARISFGCHMGLLPANNQLVLWA
jgi:hypothetical protein